MMTVYQSVQVVVLVGLMYFALKAHDVTKGPDFLCHCFLFSGEAAKFDPTFKGPMRNRWMCLVSCWLFAAVRLLWFLNPQSVWLQGFMCVLCGFYSSWHWLSVDCWNHICLPEADLQQSSACSLQTVSLLFYRGCTDIICCILFMAVILGYVVVGALGKSNLTPTRAFDMSSLTS